jgi:hypothetical protein
LLAPTWSRSTASRSSCLSMPRTLASRNIPPPSHGRPA